VIRRTTEAVLAAGFESVIVATGAQHDATADALEGLGCVIVPTPGWDEGMAASIRSGSAALAGCRKGVFVFLGDMPLVPASLCGELAELAEAAGYAARPVVDGRPGHPVCFAREAVGDLARLEGDQGAAHGLKRRTDVAYLDTDDIGAILDIDSPEDLTAAERAWKSRATSATSDSAMSRGVLPKP
jgi:molybdenum cofactor cytidylyltransferase